MLWGAEELVPAEYWYPYGISSGVRQNNMNTMHQCAWNSSFWQAHAIKVPTPTCTWTSTYRKFIICMLYLSQFHTNQDFVLKYILQFYLFIFSEACKPPQLTHPRSTMGGKVLPPFPQNCRLCSEHVDHSDSEDEIESERSFSVGFSQPPSAIFGQWTVAVLVLVFSLVL